MSDLVLHLEQNVDEPARARAFLREHLVGYPGETCEDALLLVSELVSNVVQHGALPARMILEVTSDRVHVVVHDSGSGVPGGPVATDHTATGGRGLLIVAAIATVWGISTVADQLGKGVWFELTVGP